MKSSRQRFDDFRRKFRQGLLKGDRLMDADAPQRHDPQPSIGGHHAAISMAKHEFKYTRRQLFAQYREILRGYYSSVFVLIGLVVIGALVALTPPLVLKLAIDYVFAGKPLPVAAWLGNASFLTMPEKWLAVSPTHGLAALVVILLVAEAISVVSQWIRVLAIRRLNYKLSATLRQRLYKHLAALPLAQLTDYRTGGIISRIMSDTDQVAGGVQNAVVNPIGAMLRVACILLILIATNWKLFLAAAALIPPVILLHYFIFRRLRPLWRNIQDDRSILSSRVSDMFAGIRVVRSFRRERSEFSEFGARQNTMVRKQYYASLLGRLLMTGWTVFVPTMGIVILWYGGNMVLRHTLTLGSLVMFQTYALMLLGPITQMLDSFQALQQNLGALDRVCDVLSQKPDMPDSADAQPLNQSIPAMELRNVGFGYRPEQTVLDHINLLIEPGATVAIVGPSGSGKTTLINLIARFYDVRAGAILLNGTDIRRIRLADYRRLFAMVLQDVYLFDGTVRENIAFGKRHATPEEIVTAARRANADEFISALEKSYDTQIGERGVKLSGGQKQRISIARAILADPRILILDEATSSLDTHSERLIQASLDELMRSRTTIVIAHRLSTIVQAQRILVLVDGRIVETGTHTELLEKQGVYHAMFIQQFAQRNDPALEKINWDQVDQPA